MILMFPHVWDCHACLTRSVLMYDISLPVESFLLLLMWPCSPCCSFLLFYVKVACSVLGCALPCGGVEKRWAMPLVSAGGPSKQHVQCKS